LRIADGHPSGKLASAETAWNRRTTFELFRDEANALVAPDLMKK
jgi:hypothetical protein